MKILRKLTGEGFHWELSYELSVQQRRLLSPPNDASKTDENESFRVAVLQKFTREVYVDLDEVEERHRQTASSGLPGEPKKQRTEARLVEVDQRKVDYEHTKAGRRAGKLDVERPDFLSTNFTIAIMVDLDELNAAATAEQGNQITLDVQLPFHLRYSAPAGVEHNTREKHKDPAQQTQYYREVDPVFEPVVCIHAESTREDVDDLCTSLLGRSWTQTPVLEFKMEGPVVLRVPVGYQQDTVIVALLTHLISLAGLGWLAWTSCKAAPMQKAKQM